MFWGIPTTYMNPTPRRGLHTLFYTPYKYLIYPDIIFNCISFVAS